MDFPDLWVALGLLCPVAVSVRGVRCALARGPWERDPVGPARGLSRSMSLGGDACESRMPPRMRLGSLDPRMWGSATEGADDVRVSSPAALAPCDARHRDSGGDQGTEWEQVAAVAAKVEEEEQAMEEAWGNAGLVAQIRLTVEEFEHGSDDGGSDGESEEDSCVICLDKPRRARIEPCGHSLYCVACVLAHMRVNGAACPTCRAGIHGLECA